MYNIFPCINICNSFDMSYIKKLLCSPREGLAGTHCGVAVRLNLYFVL